MRAQGALRMLATGVVIAAAAAVWHFLPTRTQVYAPFDVHGTSGRAVTGRQLTATVERGSDRTRSHATGQYSASRTRSERSADGSWWT